MFSNKTPKFLFRRLIKSPPKTIPIFTNWFFPIQKIKTFSKINLYSFSSFQQNVRPSLRQTEYQEEELILLKVLEPEKPQEIKELMEKYLQCQDLTHSDITNISEILTSLANLHSLKGNKDKALRYFKEAEALYQEAGITDTISVADSYYHQGHFYAEQENFTDAQHYLNEAERICRELGDDKKAKSLLVYCLFTFARMYELQNDKDKALELFYSVIERANDFQEEELPGAMAYTYQIMGAIYHSRNDIEKTAEYWAKALEMSTRETGKYYQQRTSVLADQLAKFIYNQGQLQGLQTALKVFPNQDHLGIAMIYANLGSMYGKANNFAKAPELLHKAIKIFEKLPLQDFARSLFECYSLLGGIYFIEKKLGEALGALSNAIKYSKINPQENRVEVALTQKRLDEIEALCKLQNI